MVKEPSIEEVLGAVNSIYQAAIDSTRWKSTIQCIGDLFEFNSCGLTAADNKAELMSVAVATGGYDSQTALDGYSKYYSSKDLLLQYALAQQDGFVLYDATFPDQGELRRSAIYNEYFPSVAADTGAAIFAYRNQERHSILSLRRVSQKGPVTEREVKILSLLTPHLARASQIHRQFSGLQATIDAFAEPLERLAIAVILVDDRARVVRTNTAAERMALSNDGVAIARGNLICAPQAMERLRYLLSAAIGIASGTAFAETSGGGVLHLPRPSGKTSYQALVTPLPRDSSFEAVAMILIKDPDHHLALPEEQLRALYALTAREAALASLLATGTSLEQAADQTGIAKETARFHLKNLFSKTDTRRQGDLVYRLMQSIAALAKK